MQDCQADVGRAARSFSAGCAGLRGAVYLLAIATSLAGAACAQENVVQRCVVSVERIWDQAGHSAFTDLALAHGYLYCTFREGSGHVPGGNGVIRILRSRDLMNWQSVAVLDEPHRDLRDPKLSLTPAGKLAVHMGASHYEGKDRTGIESRVSFADANGEQFSAPEKVIFPPSLVSGFDWLWRVTWLDGVAWGCLQQVKDKQARALYLMRSTDAVHYEKVAKLDVEFPTETTLRFLPDKTMVAMIRTAGNSATPGQIGTARPPYEDWKYKISNKRFGGPNLIQLPDGAWLAGSRDFDDRTPRTQLWWCDPVAGQFKYLLQLPSDGDNSYPGFVIDAPRNRVYVSYYSSHEGKAAIYLATLRLDAVQAEHSRAN